jgi:pyridinium-3,5-biscarboxylic acid mononucleotide synthase
VQPTKVVDAPGMPAAQLAVALEDIALEQHTAAARRVTADVYATVRTILPGVQYHGGAQMLLFTDSGADVPKPTRLPGRIAIVSGVSSDIKAAFEAKVALNMMGGYSTMYQGASAADLPGLIKIREAISDADALIVCCGEQPALAGLLASFVAVPVVALPASGRPDPLTAIDVAGAGLFGAQAAQPRHDLSNMIFQILTYQSQVG